MVNHPFGNLFHKATALGKQLSKRNYFLTSVSLDKLAFKKSEIRSGIRPVDMGVKKIALHQASKQERPTLS